MARFIHIVGQQGIGKSSLSGALAWFYSSQVRVPQRCAGAFDQIFTSRREALAEAPGADIYFIEHMDDSTLDALPGELVIRMERIPSPGPGRDAGTDIDRRVPVQEA